jgi:hypothetical protein
MTLYDTVGCIVNPLPLEDLPIVGHSDKNAKVMMHGDEGIGVDGLKELDPGPIHNGDIMEQAQSQSVLNQLWILMTLLTVPMRMKSFWFYFQSYVHLFLTLNQSWTLVWVRCLDSIWIAPALQYQPSHWNAI